MDWPRPIGVVFMDGTAEHHGCRGLARPSRPRPVPDARCVANCGACRRVATLDAKGRCSSCTVKERNDADTGGAA